MFFRQIMEAFLVRTEPASSMVNPAHIHITSAPQIRKAKVLSTNWVSVSTPAAWATWGQATNTKAGSVNAVAMAAMRTRRNGRLIKKLMVNLTVDGYE